MIGIGLSSVVLILVGAGAALWYSARTAEQPPAASIAPVEPNSQPGATQRSGAAVIEQEMLRQLLALVDERRREAILDSAEVFAQFVEQERASQAVVTAAYANAADRNEAVQTLMLRASQKVLAQAYLSQVVQRNLDANFPSEAQAQEFYDTNKGAFRLPDRIHLWQVFIPARDDAAETAVNNAKALATEVAKNLGAGKTTFKEASARYSKHLQSQLNEGYMGLLKVDDLLPEIRAAVLEREPGSIGRPIRSSSGFHVVKRGDLVAGTQLSFAAVKQRVINQLRQEAANRVRDAAVKKIAESFPVSVDESALEAWRSELKALVWPNTGGAFPQAPLGNSNRQSN